MKCLAWLALAGILATSSAYAQVPISALPAASALSGTEAVPVVQAAATVRTTPAAVSTYLQTLSQSLSFVGTATTPTLQLSGTTPTLELRDSDGAADTQRWRFTTSPTTFELNACSDNGTVCTPWVTGTRSGTTVSAIDLNATNVRINGIAVVNSNPISTSQSGTFSAAWVNGCSNDPSQNWRYTLNGNVVVVQMSGASSCTSDANNKSTASGALPSIIRPAAQQNAKYTNVNVNGVATEMCINFQPDGQIQMHISPACGTNPGNLDFTISAGEQTSLTYLIN